MDFNIQHIIEQGEGINIEFKKAINALPETLFETVCAFLNRNGGYVLLGVADNKKIIGVEKNIAETLCKQVANLSNNPQKLFPSFLLEPHIIEYQSKLIISIYGIKSNYHQNII